MLFQKLLRILDEDKEIQVYSKNGFSETLTKEEWEKDGRYANCRVLKVKNRPTDRYVYIELDIMGNSAV